MKPGVREAAMKARRERWRKIIAEAEASGEAIRQFCLRHGIRENRYYLWRRRLGREIAAGAKTESGRFVLVGTAPAGDESAALELVVERGWRLALRPGLDEGLLRTVLAALAAQS